MQNLIIHLLLLLIIAINAQAALTNTKKKRQTNYEQIKRLLPLEYKLDKLFNLLKKSYLSNDLDEIQELRFSHTLANLPKKDILELLKSTKKMENSTLKEDLENALYTYWGKIEPEKVLDLLFEEGKGEDGFVQSDILLDWSKKDPEQALSYLLTQQKKTLIIASYLSFELTDIFESLSSKNMNKAVSAIVKIKGKTHLKKSMAGLVTSVHGMEDFLKLRKTFLSYNNESVLNTYIIEWGARNPKASLNWLRTHAQSKDTKTHLQTEIIKKWLELVPEKAAEWVLKQNHPTRRLHFISEHWPWRKLSKLFSLLESQPMSLDRDKAFTELVSKESYSSLAQAYKYALHIDYLKLRKETLLDIYRRLKEDSLELANEFLKPLKDFSDLEKKKIRTSTRIY